MSTEFTTDVMEVLLFVRRHVHIPATEMMNAIGMKRDGRLVAGVLYESWSPNACWMHIAGEGENWLNRSLLFHMFDYPFRQVGVKKIFAYIDASNAPCLRFVEHIGLTRDATLEGAGTDGGDAHIYSMKKERCRFLRQRKEVA
jgi:RimJ/RimL family protein N-acetyltransferase